MIWRHAVSGIISSCSGDAEMRFTIPISATPRPITKIGHSKFWISLRSIPGIQLGLVGEETRDDLARDRRGGAAAVAAVLDEHGHHEPRLVCGHEGDEPGVVLVLVLDLFARARARGHVHDLCGARLAAGDHA